MKTILVVDDEIILREFLTELLELENYRAIGVSSCSEALIELKKQTPDMIISDMFLGGETGIDLLRKVKASGGRLVPFLLMSASFTAEMRQTAEAEGVRGFIKKPYENKALLDTVKSNM